MTLGKTENMMYHHLLSVKKHQSSAMNKKPQIKAKCTQLLIQEELYMATKMFSLIIPGENGS